MPKLSLKRTEFRFSVFQFFIGTVLGGVLTGGLTWQQMRNTQRQHDTDMMMSKIADFEIKDPTARKKRLELLQAIIQKREGVITDAIREAQEQEKLVEAERVAQKAAVELEEKSRRAAFETERQALSAEAAAERMKAVLAAEARFRSEQRRLDTLKTMK